VNLVNPFNLTELRAPVCGFQLEAFDKTIELEKAENDLQILMSEVNDRLEKDIFDRATDLSKKHGVSVEQLLANPPGGLCISLAFDVAETQRA
jgi:hypothetical protein